MFTEDNGPYVDLMHMNMILFGSMEEDTIISF